MIDWLTASVELDWSEPIGGGHFVQLAPDGTVEQCTVRSAHCRGSFDEHVTLRTVERGRIELDGNPAKFVQGHNLFGSNDLQGLVVATMVKALGLLATQSVEQYRAKLALADRHAGRELVDAATVALHVEALRSRYVVTDAMRERWLAGGFRVSRIDLTESYQLPCASDVRAWLRAAGELARMKYRGRATTVDGTLYFGKAKKGARGSRWSLKAYAKGDEIKAAGRGHKVPNTLPMRDDVVLWADDKLRVELMLRGGELDRLPGTLRHGVSWNEIICRQLFDDYFGKMQLGENVMISMEKESALKPAVRGAYALWRTGMDVRGLYSRNTYYRYRAQLLEATDGEVDIGVPVARSRDNVVELRRVLTLVPASPPTFAIGTPLLFQRAA